MNSSDQRYRLEFFQGEPGDKVEVKVETTGDRLIEAIGQVPDSVMQIVIIDLNRLEASVDDGYFFYYYPTSRRFDHMVDTAMFPASKEASDWWNEYVGGKLTWADEPSATNGWAVGVTVNCIKDGAKLKGTVTAMDGGNAKILWQVPGLWTTDGIWYTRHQVMEMGILVGEPSGTAVLE